MYLQGMNFFQSAATFVYLQMSLYGVIIGRHLRFGKGSGQRVVLCSKLYGDDGQGYLQPMRLVG